MSGKKRHPQSGKMGIGTLIALIVVIIGGIYFYSYVNNLRNESIQREQALNAQYLSNQNYLSAYVSGFYEQLDVANLKSEKLDEILVAAVKGRYEDGGFDADGAFFAAVMEQYPQLGDLNIYDEIARYVASQREGYRAIQDKLLDRLRNYDTWRAEGFVQSYIIKNWLGVPTNRLEARIGDDVVYGEDARKRMYTIVLTESTRSAYKTGTMDPLSVNRE